MYMIDVSRITDTQKIFIANEFGFDTDQISKMALGEWRRKVFLPCAELEGDLYPLEDDAPVPERCRIACELVSLTYAFFDEYEKAHSGKSDLIS